MPRFEIPIWVEVEADDQMDAWERIDEAVLESGLPVLVGVNNWSIGEPHEMP